MAAAATAPKEDKKVEASGSVGKDGKDDGSKSSVKDETFLYCVNLVRTEKDDSVRRGAVVKAVTLCSPYPFYHILKQLLVVCLDAVYKHGVEVISRIFEVINTSMPRSCMPPVDWHARTLMRCRASLKFSSGAPLSLSSAKSTSTPNNKPTSVATGGSDIGPSEQSFHIEWPTNLMLSNNLPLGKAKVPRVTTTTKTSLARG